MRGKYDHIRCPVCAWDWTVHTAECSRHDYRPSIRISADGRDVSATPAKWSDTDTFRYADEVATKRATTKRRRAKA